MSASEKAAETAKEVVADMAEGVAEQATNFAGYARQMNKAKIQFYLLGMAVGGLTGAVVAFKVAYSRAETKYSKIADAEISEMREHYQNKIVAAEATAQKQTSVQDLVVERGYSVPEDTPQPMAVQPPERVNLSEVKPEVEPEVEETEVKNVFEEAQPTHEWDWHKERRRRSPDIPYVIHIDEREELDFQSVTLTYFEGDNVLCDERDEVIGLDERDELVGENNLDRFGHGSGDVSVVYIRNDKLELIYEVVKSPNAYAEEVHGFSHGDYYKNLERMRIRERDEQED